MRRISSWRYRLARRADSEHWQAYIRLGLVGTTVLALYIFGESAEIAPQRMLLGSRILLASLIFSIGLLLAIVLRPAVSVPRRFVGILHDVSVLSVALYLGEAVLAPCAAIYVLWSVGNGFRFGTGYLYLCTALAAVSFTTVYFFSDYWRGQTTLSMSILVMVSVVPLYLGQLLVSLHRTKAQLKLQASEDPLTSLLNRAEFKLRVEQTLQANSNGHILLFCDLDHFKAVNDTAGHAAGDKLLVDVSLIIRRSVRTTDLCGRLGGDEFCMLLLDCDLDRARQVAETIRSKVAGYRLAWGQQFFSVGVSVGVAPSAATTDMESLFHLADAACYAAKNAGRNQIHVVDPRIDDADTAFARALRVHGKGNKLRGGPEALETSG